MMKAVRKIGILGGTFNPIHYGHLLIAENACEQFGLERIIFLPTGHSPHKDYAGEKIREYRYHMTELAIANNDKFVISDYETKRSDVSYTYSTLDYFQAQYPDAELYFIIGADSLKDFDTWRKPDEICKKAVILVAVRDDFDDFDLDRRIQELTQRYGGRFGHIHTPVFNVSSKDLRSRIREGHSVRYFLPDVVIDYIRENGIYRN